MNTQRFAETLTDRDGRTYDVVFSSESATFISAFVTTRNHHIGRINCLIDPEHGVLEITDLIIFDPPIIVPPWWEKLFPFLRRNPPRFRQRGLGDAMLDAIISYAEALELDTITGCITRDDLAQTPYLPDFYEKHGFAVEFAPESANGNAATLLRVV